MPNAFMPAVTCPHCAQPANAGDQFCQACGKALPSPLRSGPQVVRASDSATTSVGRTMQIDELKRLSMRAAGILIAVGVIQFIFAGIVWATSSVLIQRGASHAILIRTVTIVAGLGIVFLALGFWARKSPLPAAITGLVLYITVWVMDIIAGVIAVNRAHGQGAVAYSPFNGIIIKIFIVAILIRAVVAGLRVKTLEKEQPSASV